MTKTIKQLKTLVGYIQADDVFLDYLKKLEGANVITIHDGDITGSNVSDDFYGRLAGVFGIWLDDELKPVNTEEEK